MIAIVVVIAIIIFTSTKHSICPKQLNKERFLPFCVQLNSGHSVSCQRHTIDTEIQAKRKTTISKLITFRITKANVKEISGQIKFPSDCCCDAKNARLELIFKKAKAANILLGNQSHFDFRVNGTCELKRVWNPLLKKALRDSTI